jgi:hypothetical protein
MRRSNLNENYLFSVSGYDTGGSIREMMLTLEAPVMSNRVVAAGVQDDFHVL